MSLGKKFRTLVKDRLAPANRTTSSGKGRKPFSSELKGPYGPILSISPTFRVMPTTNSMFLDTEGLNVAYGLNFSISPTSRLASTISMIFFDGAGEPSGSNTVIPLMPSPSFSGPRDASPAVLVCVKATKDSASDTAAAIPDRRVLFIPFSSPFSLLIPVQGRQAFTVSLSAPLSTGAAKRGLSPLHDSPPPPSPHLPEFPCFRQFGRFAPYRGRTAIGTQRQALFLMSEGEGGNATSRPRRAGGESAGTTERLP